MKLLFSLFTLSLLLISCDGDLQKKLEKIQQRESELFQKEKRLALKEAEYQSLIKMRDSILQKNDTLKEINPLVNEVLGDWKGKIVATESNCQDYVVGDTRVDEWKILEENGQIIAKNFNKNGVVRVYTGNFENNVLKLSSQTEKSSSKHLDFKIQFTTVESQKLSGTREIQVNQDCVSKFTIELLR